VKLIGFEMQLRRLTGVSMNLKYFKAAVAVFGVFLFTHAVAGSDVLQAAQYSVFKGDVNGDGYPDYLVKAKIKIVMIDYDVPFPVPLKPPSPTFVLLSNGGAYSLDSNPTNVVINSAVWQPGSYEMIFGDVQGNGNISLLLQNRTSGAPSFLIAISATTGAPQLLEKLDVSAVGYDLSAVNTTIELRDASKDGRADLIVRVDGKIAQVLYASSDGTFSKPKNDQDQVGAAWAAFTAALDSNDIASAAQFIAPDAQDKYLGALASLGSAVTALTQHWSQFRPMVVKPDYALCSVIESGDGPENIHIVTFIRGSTGWALTDF
jgi:hypothetical protein